MKAKETSFSQENDQENSNIVKTIKLAPRSVRPIKSMARIQSLKPKRMSIAKRVITKKA